MKGIVLDIKEGNAVVLTGDGEIRKIRNCSYRIGQEVNVKEAFGLSPRLARWGAGIAAAFVLFVAGAFAYTTPDAYVSVDVNPSVEICINMFDRVLDAKAMNDDGRELVSSIRLKHMSIEKAIEKLTTSLIKENYISDDENGGVIITTSGEDPREAEKLATKLETKVRECIDKEGKAALVEAEAVDLERVEEARELGVTPGKLNLVQKLTKSSPDPDAIVIEEWLDKPVKEINKLIKENRKAVKEQEKAARKDGKSNDNDDADDEDEDEDRDGKLNNGDKAGQGNKSDRKNTNKGNSPNKENPNKENKEKEQNGNNGGKNGQKGNGNKTQIHYPDDDNNDDDDEGGNGHHDDDDDD